MQPYSAYKDSGAGWVGKVPEHWHVEKFRWVTTFSKHRNDDDTERPMLSLSAYDGIKFKHYEYETQKRTEEQNSTYNIVKPNQLVVNPMWVMKRSIAVSELHGIVSPAYRVYDISDDYLPKFLHYLLRSDIYVDEYNRHIRGLTTYDRSVRKEDFAELLVPIPPLEEQNAIVAFLEEQSAVIKKFLTNKRRLIELLEEQKQVIINNGVTQGLDPTAPRKPSGIEQPAKFPSHWRILRLKFLGRIRYGLGQPPKEKPGGIPMIRATNVERGRIVENEMLFVDPNDLPLTREPYLKTGDIIIVRSGAYTADSAIIQSKYNGAVTGYDMVLSVKTESPEFIAFALLSKYVLKDQLYLHRMRAAQPHLNASELGETVVFLPSVSEQRAIVDYLGQKTAEINTAIERTQREIELIEEYRTTLIASAVTGKIDVRSGV